MLNTFDQQPVIATTNVASFFEDSVRTVAERQGVPMSAEGMTYVAGILTEFSRTSRLLEDTPHGRRLPVLAHLYARAQEQEVPGERNQTMQRLGDVALFLSGVFADSFNRKLVDVDYCISMGQGAYGYLASGARHGLQRDGSPGVFVELAKRFNNVVDILNEICIRAAGRANRNLLRLYEIWLRTQSPRAAQQLMALGFTVNSANTSMLTH
jgi:hypothetical protein